MPELPGTATSSMVRAPSRRRCYVPPRNGERGSRMALADIIIIISRDGGAFVSRYLHVVFGITWIGLLYYFNFVQVPAFAEMEAAARNNAVDKLASRALWWFRWAAVATVITGLMILLFQHNSGTDPQLFDGDYIKTSQGMSIYTGILLA